MAAATESPVRGVYALTPDGLPQEELLARVRAALAGGVRLVQYRAKLADPVRRRAEGARLVRVCREAGVPLIINDDPELAREVGAAGVHVGRTDATIAGARAAIGRPVLVGASCYNRLDLAAGAFAAGADYIAFGSFFPSQVKPDAVRAEIGLIAEAKRRFALPVVAIGGISSGNVDPLIEAGVDAVAVISDIFSAADVAEAAARLAQRFQRSREPS